MSEQIGHKETKVYVQDENQKIVGNLEISGKWDESFQASQMWTIVLILPEIGAYVTYQDKSYVILSTATFQEELDKPVITTICDMLRITDEGDDAGEPTIKVNSDELTLI
jgi:hypothetical protein